MDCCVVSSKWLAIKLCQTLWKKKTLSDKKKVFYPVKFLKENWLILMKYSVKQSAPSSLHHHFLNAKKWVLTSFLIRKVYSLDYIIFFMYFHKNIFTAVFISTFHPFWWVYLHIAALLQDFLEHVKLLYAYVYLTIVSRLRWVIQMIFLTSVISCKVKAIYLRY